MTTGYISEKEAAALLNVKPETMRKYRNDHIGGWRYRKTKVKVDTLGRTVRRGIQWSVHYIETEMLASAA